MTSERHDFFGLADEKLYYDEKRKRFVNTAQAPSFVHRQYYQGHFKEVSATASTPRSELVFFMEEVVSYLF